MPNFVLSAVIENRKSILLDLTPLHDYNDLTDRIGEDIYIIEFPDQENTLLSISRKKSLQSLINNEPDISIKDLDVNCTYEEGNRQIILDCSLSANSKPVLVKQKHDIEKSLSVRFSLQEEEIILTLQKEADYRGMKEGSVDVIVRLHQADMVYHDHVRFFYAPPKKIKLAGLDFGSEASQIMDGSAETTNPNTFDLLSAIKNKYYSSLSDDQNYQQRERENHFFYKSIFYAKKNISDGIRHIAQDTEIIDLHSNLDVLTTPKIFDETDFFKNRLQVPNLKLIGENTNLGNHISFSVTRGNRVVNQSLNELKDPVYAGLLEGMILAYLDERILDNGYLRFTLLVPNIYNIEKVSKVKSIVRHIIQDANKHLNNNIKALEISTLSESDAAFLGIRDKINVKPGKYYIVIDCGKGTTDFSIIRAYNGASVKSEYRNGFAGAGNLISFAIMQSICAFLKQEFTNDPQYQQEIIRFFEKELTEGPVTGFKQQFYQEVERLKMSYDGALSRSEVEEHWKSAASGNVTFSNVFGKTDTDSTFITLLGKIEQVYDWGGYIHRAFEYIADHISINLTEIIQQLNDTSSCGKIVFTGRGFYFNPLRIAVRKAMEGIKGINESHFMPEDDTDLKQVCMQGIFKKGLITHADIISTLFEMEAGTNRRIFKREAEPAKWYAPYLKKIMSIIPSSNADYSIDDQNRVEVKDSQHLPNCQFWSGSTMYTVGPAYTREIEGAHLVQTRQGIYIVVRFKDGDTTASKLVANHEHSNNSEVVFKSLFPGYLNRTFLNK